MRIHEVKTYFFSELSEEAQQKAIDNNRDWNVDYEWWDYIYDDAKAIGEILGITIKDIWFSGFYTQGSGACFTGSYEYGKGSCNKIREYAPKDETLHGIADRLRDIQRTCFYGLYAYIEHRGHYNHEYCTDIDVRDTDEYSSRQIPADEIAECLRDFMRWIYRRLESEYEYLTSDDVVKESLEINEIEFLENGERY